MFVSAAEINTHLYPEQMTAISGADETLLLAAIKGAEQEAKGYLHAYDLDAVFNAAGDARDQLLVIWVKDIAVWHYINICRPNVDFDIRETRYKAAITWLKGVQKGDIVPGFPVPVDPDTGEEENTTPFSIGSNPKRGNYI